MKYDFDTYVERRGTASVKWDTYPDDVLALWVADSDFRSPPEVADAIMEVARRGLFGYPLGYGNFERACIHWQKTRFGFDVEKEQIAWCPSLGTAIGLCINAFTNPGDGVAMLWPIYPPFMSTTVNNGRKLRGTTLRWNGSRHEVDFNELEEALALPDTRLFLLCNPHNPTGRVFERDELLRMGELCRKYNVTVFSDEIHEDFVYRGPMLPFASLSPELAAISLVGVNASKTFNVADLRSAGVISLSPDLLASFTAWRDRVKIGASSLGLAGVSAAWEKGADYADQLVLYLKANLEHAVKRINGECKGISAYMPEATYLLWLDCRKIALAPAELTAFFIEKARVALNNGADFGPGGEGFMRLNAACPRSTLDEAIDRIAKALMENNVNAKLS